MKKSHGFQFKQFFIAHDKCAMKVNTDGILLGAISDPHNTQNILDLGTGSGLVAIMLAQRTNTHCKITALELEPSAYQQAVENAQASTWAERIFIQQGDVLQTTFKTQFDLIVSNPPYFIDSLESQNQERTLARNATQSHLDWLNQAKKWLAPQGRITFILPTIEAEKLITEDKTSGLFCTEIYYIITKTGQIPKRIIVTFTQESTITMKKELVIYNEQNQYTADFMSLTKDFYLNM